MTVNTSTNKAVVLGDNSETVFTFDFIGVAAAYITVTYTAADGTETVLQQGSGATQCQVVLNAPVEGAIWGVGGTVTYAPNSTPIASGTTLSILRTLPEVQSVSLTNQGPPFPASVEIGLDKLEMQIQQSAELFGRAFVVPVSDPTPAPVPPIALRANLAAIFDSVGNMIAGQMPASGVISSVMQPVVAAGSLEDARDLLGVSAHGPVFATRTAAAAATIDADIGMVFTGGYSTAGDLGGASYVRVGGSTTGGFQSADGQWWALLAGAGCPEMMGAKGDAAINGTSGAVTYTTDDTQAIENAFNYFRSCYFPDPRKIYAISKIHSNWCVEVHSSNHIIMGNGAQLAMIDGTFTPGVHKIMVYNIGLLASYISNIRYENLRLYGNAKNQGLPDSSNEYSGLQYTFVSNSAITRCEVTEVCGDAIPVVGDYVSITDNIIQRSGKAGIYVPPGASPIFVGVVTMSGNNIAQPNWDYGQGSFFGGDAYACITTSGIQTTVTGNNCVCGSKGEGIQSFAEFDGTSNVTGTLVTIQGNTIQGALGPGINIVGLPGGTANSKWASVAGNTVIACGSHGITAQNVSFVSIGNNVIQSNGGYGILINETSASVDIYGGVIEGNALDGVAFIGCTDCTLDVANNNNNTGTGFSFGNDGSGTASNTDCSIGDTRMWRNNSGGTVDGSSISNFSTGTTGVIQYTTTWDPGSVADGATATKTFAAAGVRASGQKTRCTTSLSQLSTGGVLLFTNAYAMDGLVTTAFNKTGGAWAPGSGVLTVDAYL